LSFELRYIKLRLQSQIHTEKKLQKPSGLNSWNLSQTLDAVWGIKQSIVVYIAPLHDLFL